MASKSALNTVRKLALRKATSPPPRPVQKVKSFSKPKTNASPSPQYHPKVVNGKQIADLDAPTLTYEPLEVPGQHPVPRLANKLDRVLFSPGVHFLKDPRTNVYNFDSRLEQIMSITDFDFRLIAPYVPAGRDSRLSQLARQHGRKYTGSTSSLTSVLTQLHHAISHQRPPQILNLPKYFPGNTTTFSAVQRAPTNLWLVRNPATETYAVAAAASGDELILTLLGQVMEAMLTTDCSEFVKWSKRHPENVFNSNGDGSAVSAAAAAASSTYNYTTCGPFLMRSQLDCYDPRLPGTGMFDLKTRASCAIRHDLDYAQIRDGSDYQILKNDGQYESFAREFYELVRSAMFKYSLQARIGRMDGIFIAYHSVRRLFGFEYMPLSEIDKIYHTAHFLPQETALRPPSTRRDSVDLDTRFTQVASLIADEEFKLSMHLLASIFEELHSAIPDSASGDLNIVVHCTAPGQLLVFARAGTYGAAGEPVLFSAGRSRKNDKKSANSNDTDDTNNNTDTLDTIPPDLYGFRVTLTQTVNNKFIPNNRFPSLHSSSDKWHVSATMEKLGAADLEARFRETQAQYVMQEFTSEPRTDRLPDPEELESQLSQLPEATELQALLRRLDRAGRTYAEWDDQRPKIEL